MYEIVQGYGRKRTKLADVVQFTDVEYRLTFNELSTLYTDVWYLIRNAKFPDTPLIRLPLELIPVEYISRGDIDITEYLVEMESKTIPSLNGKVDYRYGEMYAWDAIYHGFDYISISPDAHPRATIPEEDKPDLLLTKPDYDYRYFGQYCLISVNGLIHPHIADKNGWTVLGGNITKTKRLNKTHVNILDFTQIGKVDIVPITDKMIRPATVASKYSDNVYINVKQNYEGDLSRKTIGIVLGGYLHLLDHVIKRVSTDVVKIDFNSVMWETLYYKMKDITDVSHFGLTDFGNDRVLGFELYHDTTIKKLFTMDKSFIVVIDTPYIGIEEIPVGNLGIPNKYQTAIKPIYPLRIAEGRYPAYHKQKEHDVWAISIEDNIVPLPVRYQKPADYFHMIHNRIYPLNGEVYATATFMRYYAYTSIDSAMSEKDRPQLPLTNLVNEDINSEYYTIITDQYAF